MPENPTQTLIKRALMVGVGLLVLVIAGFLAWMFLYNKPVSTPDTGTVVVDDTSVYASSTMGISITYPKSFSVNDVYVYDQFEKKPIHGVKFTIPDAMVMGTNLSSDTGISVEQLPRAKNCTGDIYLVADVRAISLTQGSTTYSIATSSGAATGNLYEEMVYAVASSSPCTAVRYFLHSTDIGSYPPATNRGQGGEPDTIREFDRAALLREFDTIRRSLIFQ